jgi:hypothetical protein
MEASELDDAFRPWAARLAPAERRALRRWQADNDGFAQIQRRLRAPGAGYDARLDGLVTSLVVAVGSGRVPAPLTVWRGVRSSTETFGVPGHRLPSLVGRAIDADGFLSTTTDQARAREEFLRPVGAGGPVLMELHVARGEPAGWLPLGGWSGLAGERELLLLPNRRILATAVTFEDDLPILRGEVS